MSKVTLIQHINIQISNRERTRAWYEKGLGAEFLDRGPELNKRQLQLRIGSAEIHTTDVTEPVRVPSVHFAHVPAPKKHCHAGRLYAIVPTHDGGHKRYWLAGRETSHGHRLVYGSGARYPGNT